MVQKIFSKKELLFLKDYCVDMMDLFKNEQKIEKVDFIFMDKTENLFLSEGELYILLRKIENLLQNS